MAGRCLFIYGTLHVITVVGGNLLTLNNFEHASKKAGTAVLSAGGRSDHFPGSRTASPQAGLTTYAEPPQVICSDYEVLFKVVQNTDSWLVAPEMTLLQEQQSGRIHRIELSFPDACIELEVIEQEGRSRSPAAGEFLRLCREAFGAGGIAD